MTQEEKANAYDEAIERAKGLYEQGMMPERIEYIFPELKESEDEGIRKDIIQFFRDYYFDKLPAKIKLDTLELWSKWLEKQGEQKVVKFMTKSYITPNPKFFQWIYDRLVYQHHENPNMDYMRSLKERIEDMQEIVNVKTGNVLVRQKPAWSEEDENMLQKALSTIRYALSIPIDKEDDPYFVGSSTIAWLKSLKERYTWKPSDEQIEALWDSIPENVKEISEREMLLDSLYQDLKKLRKE